MSERYKCDRNGGSYFGAYMRRPRWACSRCGEYRDVAGHRCGDCRRRVCCPCFDHLDAVCATCSPQDMLTNAPDISPPKPKDPHVR